MRHLKNIFISYSHKDNDIYINLLRTQLSVLERTRSVRIWTDQDIRAGKKWETEINEAIDTADLFILMISANFFESTFIQEKELPSILLREKNNKLTLFPIIIEPCAWDIDERLSKTQARPQNGQFVCDADDDTKKAIFSDITKEINDILFSETTKDTTDDKIVPAESQTHHCGKFVHLMCDRANQVVEFRKTFLRQCESNENHKKPQFYVIHGKERNGHLSLVERLKIQVIQPFVNEQAVKKTSSLLVKPGWPEKGDLDMKMDILLDALFAEIFNQNDSLPIQYSLKALIQSDPIKAFADHAVIIAHRIPANHWDLDLANRYISDFMSCAADLSIVDTIPLFIVFFNIEYPRLVKRKRSLFFRKKPDPMKELEYKIRSMVKELTNKKHCQLIKELQTINTHHVIDWFNSHQKKMGEPEKFKAVDSIFDAKDECLMFEIEDLLKKYVP